MISAVGSHTIHVTFLFSEIVVGYDQRSKRMESDYV